MENITSSFKQMSTAETRQVWPQITAQMLSRFRFPRLVSLCVSESYQKRAVLHNVCFLCRGGHWQQRSYFPLHSRSHISKCVLDGCLCSDKKKNSSDQKLHLFLQKTRKKNISWKTRTSSSSLIASSCVSGSTLPSVIRAEPVCQLEYHLAQTSPLSLVIGS